MLQIILAWLYITAVCWGWGWLMVRLTGSIISRDDLQLPSFPVTCLAGLSVLAVLSGYLSLFIPLGVWEVQAILLLPVLLTLIVNRNRLSSLAAYIKTSISGYPPLLTTIMILFALLSLIMGAWTITHPDTLGYHIQTIKWIENYPAVPGLAHLHIRYGYQGLWYCLSALFSFTFTGAQGINFLNSTVMIWFILFITQRLNDSLAKLQRKERDGLTDGILYTLLLFISSWNYVQVRLTVTSANADFIAALFVWLTIYLVAKKEKDKSLSFVLAALFGITAVAVKLSAAFVLVFALYCLLMLLRQKQKRAALFLFFAGLIIMFPFVSRNYITSGYAIFPSPVSALIDTDWKISEAQNELERKYIKAYARVGDITTKAEIEAAASLELIEWVPIWWKRISLPDKLLLISLLLLTVTAAFFYRSIKKANENFPLVFFTSIAALAFWIWQAPDPRFAHGFIIPIQGIILKYLLDRTWSFPVKRYVLNYGIAAYIILLFAYGTYRLTYYFSEDLLIQPSGPVNARHISIQCHNMNMNMPLDGQPCGNTPLPCVYDCDSFEMRGNDVRHGFRGKRE